MQTKFLFLSLSLALTMLASVMVFAKGNNQQAINPDKTGTEVGNLAENTLTPAVTLQVSKVTPELETKGVTELALEKLGATEILTQKVNGIEVSVANFRLNDYMKTVEVDACYQQPQNNLAETIPINTTLVDSSIQAGNLLFLSSESLFLEHSADYVCQRITFVPFQIQSKELDLSQLSGKDVTLTLGYLLILPKEGYECNFYQKVQEVFGIRGIDIKIDCFEQDGMVHRSVTNLPEGMTESELWKQISDEFLLFKGPWEFVLEVR